uniref:Secreted protein n=1 Tax=Heligmosomoides polygyrus TaxID=6339 RepID=A0A183GUE2_HELPZ
LFQAAALFVFVCSLQQSSRRCLFCESHTSKGTLANTMMCLVKRHYDFVRFGRSMSPEKKASYDYIRFGKRSSWSPAMDGARFSGPLL